MQTHRKAADAEYRPEVIIGYRIDKARLALYGDGAGGDIGVVARHIAVLVMLQILVENIDGDVFKALLDNLFAYLDGNGEFCIASEDENIVGNPV